MSPLLQKSKLTPIVGFEGIYPIIQCTAWSAGLKFYCQYCKLEHHHGTGAGHRVSHCFRESPYKEHGYILREPNEAIQHD